MNTTAESATNVKVSSSRWLWVAVALVVGLLAVSGDSLWVDEALTANEVSRSSLSGMWEVLTREKMSDLQMPLYLVQMWAWVKVFGTSEWALRAMNIPWIVGAVAACAAAFSGRKRAGVVTVVLANSFVWYFLNEARPYALQVSTSLIALSAMVRLSDVEIQGKQGLWLAAFCFAVVCLSGSSLLGMIWAGGFVLALAWCMPWARLKELVTGFPATILVSFVLLGLIGAYYLWTLHLGARATGGTTDARNLVFIAYQLLGFGGLGPGRLDIREGMLATFRPYLIPLAIYAALTASVGWLGVTSLLRSASRARLLGLFVIAALPMITLATAGRFLHFRVLERHCAPAIVIVAGVMSAGLAEGWARKGWHRWVNFLFMAASIVSCAEVRLAVRHKKDDYRDAVADAKAALGRGERVWWNAGWHGAVYYHLPLGTNAGDSSAAFWISNSVPISLGQLPTPALVIASKPDLYDQSGAVADFIRKGSYEEVVRYPAFVQWRRKSGRAEEK